MRLAFATADPLSIFLTALAAWLIVHAGYRRHRGELILAACTRSRPRERDRLLGARCRPSGDRFRGSRLAPRHAAPAVVVVRSVADCSVGDIFALMMTATHSWPGLFSTLFAPGTAESSGCVVSNE